MIRRGQISLGVARTYKERLYFYGSCLLVQRLLTLAIGVHTSPKLSCDGRVSRPARNNNKCAMMTMRWLDSPSFQAFPGSQPLGSSRAGSGDSSAPRRGAARSAKKTQPSLEHFLCRCRLSLVVKHHLPIGPTPAVGFVFVYLLGASLSARVIVYEHFLFCSLCCLCIDD